MLVTTEQLAKHLDDWTVVDTRHDLTDPKRGPKVYAEGHIPGAHFLHVDTDLSAHRDGANGRHPLPDLATFAATLNRIGVAPGRKVVTYDDSGGGYALRLWWMLRWLGHDDVAVLDGQFPAWAKEGRPVSAEVPPARPGAFVPRPQLGATVDAAYVGKFGSASGVRLVDARNAERFEGRAETLDPVAGHIPGAANRFWQANLGPDGRFKKPGELRAEFGSLLAGAPADRVVHYCGSGVTACHNLFAMELAGLPGSRLYPGSWSEWCADPQRPVATGP